jgi:hypothetical protein
MWRALLTGPWLEVLRRGRVAMSEMSKGDQAAPHGVLTVMLVEAPPGTTGGGEDVAEDDDEVGRCRLTL